MIPDDDVPASGGIVAVTFNMHQSIYDRMWTAAARDGLTFTDVLNRSVDFYDRMMNVPSGCTLRLSDPRGELLMVVQIIQNVVVDRHPYLQERPPRARWHRSWRWPFGR